MNSATTLTISIQAMLSSLAYKTAAYGATYMTNQGRSTSSIGSLVTVAAMLNHLNTS